MHDSLLLLIPSIMAKVALLVPVVIGICKVLKVKAKSATASALMLVVFFALWSPKMAFIRQHLLTVY